LNIASKSKNGFPPEARTFLEQIAPYLTQAIKNAQLYEALAESTKNYRTLHENVPVGLFRSKPDGEILSANRTMWKMFGYSNSDEIVSIQAASLYECPEERKIFIHKLSNQGKILDFETRMKKKNGSLFYASVTARAIKNNIGRISYIDGIITNINKRKSAESALKKSENQLKERVKELEGMYSLERLADKTINIDELLNTFAENIVPQSMLYPEKTLTVIEIENNKYGNSNLDDITCSLSAPIMINGKRKGTLSIGYSEDLSFIDYHEQKLVDGYAKRLGRIIEGKQSETALKKSEELLSSFLHSAPSIFILTDYDFNILLVNKTGKKELGEIFNRSFEKPEANLSNIFPNFLISGSDEKYRNVLKTGEPLTLNNIRVLSSTDEIYMLTTAFKVGDRLGLTMRDVTLQKKMQEDLIKMEKLESLGVLAGGLAHDFNNILAALLGNISLAQMYLDTKSKAWGNLAEAEKAIDQATGLTKQLLTFAKGGLPIRETANINNLLKDSVRFILRGTKSQARFRLAADLWNIDVDLGQLGQVVNNLILNSVHAMPDGGTIEIKAENIPDGSKVTHELENNKYIKISIKDYGSGIPDNIREKIFDPYFTTKTEGSGLGLAGAHSIINNHSGYLKFESQTGAGTVFEIYLPASRKKAPLIVKDFDQTLGGEGKILIMDDDMQVLTITENILGHIGFHIETAENGKEAIRKYKAAFNSNNPYLALLMLARSKPRF